MLRPDLLLHAYSRGIFPMAEPGGRIAWYAPDPRALIPLDERFRIPKSLRKRVQAGTFVVTADRAFDAVLEACAEPAPGRASTWISGEIARAYGELHRLGWAHSVECWRDGELVGGLYGVALGGAFFGESMFHRATDASKVALVHLVERLRAGGFTLLDTQFMTDHLARFGAYEVRRRTYERLLADAIARETDWRALDRDRAGLPSVPSP